ncbi:AAC(3) family N-acetyltransferase [Vallitalea pronyensis]|uniref:Aminoglycoside N(3)-acetyltransferase n=1 Tax=Vallitalea pronyensis TaxID=1348613 RepID=A0A8J8MJM9_9FIRM|nr:AAC(3) family N-acetyltransferase [Vallitalea pronyensis]QUI22905.1 AAC(3) family N-acetyltransferase [Vallitalea pronyensis]
MLIFGWGLKTVKRYGMLSHQMCQTCHTESGWQLVKVTTWFTLFFIPVMPVSIKRMLICTKCNAGRIIKKELFNQLVEKVQQGGSPEAPQDTSYQNMTDTQKNYLQEMEAYRNKQENELNKKTESKKARTQETLIQQSSHPMTRTKIGEQLRAMGLREGMTVIVHSAMSKIGWISGGPIAVIQGLMDAVTEEGTIVMPAHTADYSDPTHWESPPIPKDWIAPVKDSMPAFDKRYTPTCGMGIIPELFRNYPGVLRSDHPQVSFAAWGKHAQTIVDNHELDYGLGDTSPLAKVYDLGGKVLLLGVSNDRNTSLHLAEYRIGKREEIENTSPMQVGQETKWVGYKDIDLNVNDFNLIGKAMEEAGKIAVGHIGQAKTLLMDQRDAVDFACHWMEENR